MDTHPRYTRGTGIPPQRVQLASLAPCAGHALLPAVGESHGPRSRREAEADCATGAEKRRHVGERRCGVKQILSGRKRSGEAGHAAGFRGLAHARSLRHLLSAFAPASFGGQLGGTSADLAEMLLVRGHCRDGGALGRLQRSAQCIEVEVSQLAQRLGLDPVAERGEFHPRHSTRSPQPDPGARASICCITHTTVIASEGGTAGGSSSP